MAHSTARLKLGAALFPGGGHLAAWRHPGLAPDRGLHLQHYVEAAQVAESGKLDLLFIADSLAMRGSENLATIKRQAHVASFEPITLLSALAAVTSHIGLVATASTSFFPPYIVARQFGSLDLLSGGRAGWNLVTSTQQIEAQNFGTDRLSPHDSRYVQAAEFADVVFGLWDSWDLDALVADPVSGLFFDPAKVHILNHQGPHYAVRGPLHVARSPQRRPVLVQAGASDAGRDFAAGRAEVVFTAQRDLASARAFYADMKRRATGHGRDPADLKIMPGVSVIVGRTEAEAKDKRATLGSLIHDEVAVALLSAVMGGYDLSPFPLDGSLPELPLTEGPRSRQHLLVELARREHLSIRQLAIIVAETQGHRLLVGSAEQVADDLEAWLLADAADGFITTAPLLPDGLVDFVSLVIPELQRRGRFRSDYEGTTLRANLGLRLPVSRYAAGTGPSLS